MAKLDSSNMRYHLTTAALVVALILSVISWLHLCSQVCAEGHLYRLYGFTFEDAGFIFFPLLLATHLFSRWFAPLATLTGWLLCVALGAEVLFIYVQKYKIGSWCPVCLSIAAALLFSGIAYFYEYYRSFKFSFEREDRGYMMNVLCKGFTGIVFFMAGFIVAFGGLGKQSKLHAQETSVKEQIAFGNMDSPIDVFVFTDWACPGCRHLEPTLETMAPAIMQKARLTFVDDPVHDETMNYTPFNLSFMVHNKSKYFALRNSLSKLSEDTKAPTEEQIDALAAKHGIQYKHLNYSDVQIATKYFAGLIKKLNVEGTPTLVVVNSKNKKAKKLEGRSEITQEGVLKAIESLSK